MATDQDKEDENEDVLLFVTLQNKEQQEKNVSRKKAYQARNKHATECLKSHAKLWVI